MLTSEQRAVKPAPWLQVLLVLCLALAGLTAIAQKAEANGGYPDSDAVDCSAQFGVYSWCKGGSWYSSRGYGYRNCTDYVAWKLQSLGVPDSKTRGLGNGGEWATKAQGREGVTVNQTPAYGAAAVNTTAAGGYGHVSFVETVHSDGTITISEYNYGTKGGHGTRRGTKAQLGISSFVHFGLQPAASPQGAAPSGFAGVGAATFLGKSTLQANQVIGPNQYILSEDARYVAMLQPDGNFVIYSGSRGAIWSTGTAGRSVTALIMQGDGNLVLYGPNGSVVWTSNTGASNPTLVMQPDGNLVIYGSGGAVWSTGTAQPTDLRPVGSDARSANQAIERGYYLRSADKRFVAALQSDGNFVVYGPGYRVFWSTGTAGRSVTALIMQGDGNLVLYGPNGTVVWHANIGTPSNPSLIMQSDGNLVVYGSGGAVWSTGTAGKL